jgi:DNA-binding MarR family transcriptional regulator
MIMPPQDMLDIIFLIVAIVTTVGLPHAIGGSLQSGKMQRFRSEENAVRFFTILGIAIFDGVMILPLVQIDVQIDTMVVLGLVGVCFLVSWKMFSKGTERGTDLFSLDLNSMSETLSQTITHLKEETALIKNDHKDDAQSIQNHMSSFAKKLELDKKIQDYAKDSVKQEVDEHIQQIYRYCNETLDMCKKDNEEIADKVVERITEMLEEKRKKDDDDDANSTIQDKEEEPHTKDIDDKINIEETSATTTTSSGPTDTQKSQKILHMASANFSEYRPKSHKLCIVMYNLLKNRQTMGNESYRPNLSEISGLSGVNKSQVKMRLQALANQGLVTMNKGKQSRIEFELSPKLHKLFNPVLENQREGGMESFFLIQQAKRYHLDNEDYFEVLKQDITIEQPDAVSIPMLDNDSFDVLNGVAIEIESPQEIRSHPQQVKSNMTKSLQWFSRVEMWCYDDTQDKIQDILEEINPQQRDRIMIMPVHQDGSLA